MDRPALQLSDYEVQHAPHQSCMLSSLHSASACGALAMTVALMRLDVDKAMTNEEILEAYDLREQPKKRH